MMDSQQPVRIDERRVTWIGRSLILRGELIASEDLAIAGTFEGTIKGGEHALTISDGAVVKADLIADTITIAGTVVGNVTAREGLHLHATACMNGHVQAPRCTIADGALVQGTIAIGRYASEPPR
jgi:cytoskeletal protein CcmA (bactofilin family)